MVLASDALAAHSQTFWKSWRPNFSFHFFLLPRNAKTRTTNLFDLRICAINVGESNSVERSSVGRTKTRKQIQDEAKRAPVHPFPPPRKWITDDRSRPKEKLRGNFEIATLHVNPSEWKVRHNAIKTFDLCNRIHGELTESGGIIQSIPVT